VTALPIAIIAAVARNGVIGANNGLIWRLSSDLKRFRALTMGKPVIMGRKTFESIGRPLPGREIIVVTRDAGFSADGVRVATALGAALSIGEEICRATGASEIIVAGGGELYRQTMHLAQRLYLTEVGLTPGGDTHFPAVDPALWRETKRERGKRGERDEAEFEFVEYVRIA